MNAEDLARLAIAKRAYQATQPSAREIQTGVRRARLSLERRKPRRNWFSKGLVMVVLAAGGLAYAKPQALAEVVAQVIPTSERDLRGTAPGRGARASHDSATTDAKTRMPEPRAAGSALLPTGLPSAPAVVATPERALRTLQASQAVNSTNGAASASATSGATARAASAVSTSGTAAGSDNAPPGERRSVASVAPSGAPAGSTKLIGSPANSGMSSGAAPEPALTEWGRVGRALARGEEQKALSALADLSESDDPRTRDKADLGRAQLLLAHGNAEKACAIARSLTQRRAGSRIERQAQVLLKSCR